MPEVIYVVWSINLVHCELMEAQKKNSSKMANYGQNQHQASSAEQGYGIIFHKKSENGRFWPKVRGNIGIIQLKQLISKA